MGRQSDARRRLLSTAMELMCARGYTAVGVQEICVHAGVNKGSFYHFFPSKQALVLAVIDAYGEHIQTLWAEALRAPGAFDVRLRQVFEATYDAHRTLFSTHGQLHGCPLGNLALELSCQDETIRQRLQDVFILWVQTIEQGLQEAVSLGDLPPTDTKTVAQIIVAYFEGVILLAKTQNDPDIVKRLASGVLQLIEPGMGR